MDDLPPRAARRAPVLLAGVAVLACLGGFALLSGGSSTPDPDAAPTARPSVGAGLQARLDLRRVPDVVGLAAEDAADLLASAGLRVAAAPVSGVVSSQAPAAGTCAASGTSVVLAFTGTPPEGSGVPAATGGCAQVGAGAAASSLVGDVASEGE